jgi:hypothetical protein
MRKKILSVIVALCICLSLLALIPQAKAQPKFVIASWDYPDEYGQGIDAFGVYENSTGSWLAVGGFVPNVAYNEEGSFDWNASLGIKIRVYCLINSTLVGFGSVAEGKLYQQHDVVVTQSNGTVVFSQQNFTYFAGGAIDEMYEYDYDVVLNFLPDYGEIYTVTITYEIYW